MAELKARIRVVDDDQRLRDLLVKYLSGEGYDVKAVPDAKGMDKQLGRERYALVVLALSLPGEDGLAICRGLRGQQTSPAIIMLTAKGDDVDRIVGLEMGADDYLPKPFNPRELLARINAVLRRKAPAGPPGAPGAGRGPASLRALRGRAASCIASGRSSSTSRRARSPKRARRCRSRRGNIPCSRCWSSTRGTRFPAPRGCGSRPAAA